MKKRSMIPLVVLMIVSLSCNFLAPKGQSHNADVNQVFDKLPAYDPKAPLPSSGAAALRLLAQLDPSVAVLESDVEAAERAALNALFADLQFQPGAGNGIEVPFLPSQYGSAKLAIPAARATFLSGYKPVGDSGNFSFEATFVGILTSQLIDDFGTHMDPVEGKYASGKEGGATTDTGITFKKNPDGSTSLEVTTKTDASKQGVSANTDSKVSVDGQRCPNAAGQVSFTIKEHFNAESGGASYTVDLTAYVRVEVNDDAEMVNITIDTTQGTRKVKDGKNVYVESGLTTKNGTESNQRLIRSSQEATSSDVSNLSTAGEAAAYNMALGSLLFARSNWLKGGCTKIEATSPGTVEPGSTTAIPVIVRHRIDGTEVPSKLNAVLSGGKSIDPTTLPKTPGTLNYAAPDESKKTATITLTATSRRGKATLELTANTSGQAAYRIVGGLNDWQTDTAVCDIMQPFTLTGSAGITMNLSGGLSGTYTYTAQMFNLNGTGTYTISLPNGAGKEGHMTGSGVGSAEGSSNTGTEEYTLTPIDPAAGCTQ